MGIVSNGAVRQRDMLPVQRLTSEYSAEQSLGPDYDTVALDSSVDGQVVVRAMPPLDESK